MASGNRNIPVTVTRPGSYPQYSHCQELCVYLQSGHKYAGGHWTPRITAPANAGLIRRHTQCADDMN